MTIKAKNAFKKIVSCLSLLFVCCSMVSANTPGIADTKYSDRRDITCSYDIQTKGYILSSTKEIMPGRNTPILTKNNVNSWDWINPGSQDFSHSGGTDWIFGSWSAFTQSQQALDVHWGEKIILEKIWWIEKKVLYLYSCFCAK